MMSSMHCYTNTYGNSGTSSCHQIFCQLWCNHDEENVNDLETCNYQYRTIDDDMATKIKLGDISNSFSANSINCGVTIQFLVDFCNHFNLWETSTRQVQQKLIVPLTKAGRFRFVDLPVMQGSGIVGTAVTFISHCWDGKFGDLVAAICDGAIDYERRVWIDIFAAIQWPDVNVVAELNFELVIQACPSFLLVCPYIKEVDKIQNAQLFYRNSAHIPTELQSQIPLYRLWCIFELLHAITLGAKVVIKAGHHILKPAAGDNDKNLKYFQFESKVAMFLRLTESVNIENATVLNPADRDMILDRIRQYPGALKGANEKIREVIRTALYGCHCPLVQSAACGDCQARNVVLSDRTGKYICFVAAGGYISWLREMVAKMEEEAYGSSIRERMRIKDEALLYAARGGQLPCVMFLVAEAAADVDACDKNDVTCLMYACSGGNFSCVEYLLNKGADLSVKDRKRGKTALMYAADEGYLPCIECLLRNGAELHTRDQFSYTALKYARMNGHSAVVDYLKSQGANEFIPWTWLQTAILRIYRTFPNK